MKISPNRSQLVALFTDLIVSHSTRLPPNLVLRLFFFQDGYLDTWHSLTLEPATVVPQNKGISLIARWQSDSQMTFQICIQQRRKLLLYEFVGRFELLSVRKTNPFRKFLWPVL